MTADSEPVVHPTVSAEACPCLHTTPCDPRCTCINPVSSVGCLRCCAYGSAEQQRSNAERLARAIDGAHARDTGWHPYTPTRPPRFADVVRLSGLPLSPRIGVVIRATVGGVSVVWQGEGDRPQAYSETLLEWRST